MDILNGLDSLPEEYRNDPDVVIEAVSEEAKIQALREIQEAGK